MRGCGGGCVLAELCPGREDTDLPRRGARVVVVERGQGARGEREAAALRRQIAALENAIIERQATLVDLRAEFAAFEARYEAEVGGRIRRLQAVEAEVARCRALLRLHGQWGHGGLPLDRDGTPHVPVGEQYRRTWVDPPPPGPNWEPPCAVAAAPQGEIRALYRALCRRYHPDLTQEEGDRAWRNEVMVAVNDAYAARDVARLRAIAARPPRGRTSSSQQSGGSATPTWGGEKINALVERLACLQRTLRQLEGEVDALVHSPLVELSVEVKLAAAQGRDLLAEIAADVEAEWVDRQADLADLRAQMRARGV